MAAHKKLKRRKPLTARALRGLSHAVEVALAEIEWDPDRPDFQPGSPHSLELNAARDWLNDQLDRAGRERVFAPRRR